MMQNSVLGKQVTISQSFKRLTTFHEVM